MLISDKIGAHITKNVFFTQKINRSKLVATTK